MTSEQFAGLVRTVLAFLAGYVPATVMGGSDVAVVVSAVVVLATAWWSWYSKKPA